MAGTSSGEPKKYGLVIPPKKKNPMASVGIIRKKSSIFDNDEDESDTLKPRTLGEAVNKDGNKSLWKKDTQIQIQKALEQDPNAFEYDSVFDQMEQKKAELEGRVLGKEKEKSRKPKYIEALLAAAKDREMEHERRLERKVQRERETEGTEFADKEAFVTSSYKKKMQEFQEQEARDRALAQVESKLDVTKQKDLSGFYRHFLKQQTGEEKVRNAGESLSVSPSSSGNATKTIFQNVSVKRDLESLPEGETKKSCNKRLPSPSSTFERVMDSANSRSPPSSSSSDEELPPIPITPKEHPPETVIQESEKKTLKTNETFTKRSTEDSVVSARERFLARQAAKRSDT